MEPAATLLTDRLVGRVVLCGSLRRLAATCGDIDLVISDGSAVVSDLVSMGLTVTSVGEPRTRLHMEHPSLRCGIEVDVWAPRPGHLGACVMHATGSARLNMVMRRWGFMHGLQLSWQGVRDRETGLWIAGETEEDCCEALGWPCVPPEMRDRPDRWIVPYLEEMERMEGV